MHGLIRVGRLLYAVAIFFFGMQCLVFGSGKKGLIPAAGPPWVQTERGLALLVGLGMMMAGICLVLRFYGRLVANVLGFAILLRGLVIYLAPLLKQPHDPGPWTSLFELVAMGGAALVIGGTFPATVTRSRDSQGSLVELGRWLFAASLIVFGVQHLMYAKFVAALIPAWIPGRVFWAFATGIAFLLVAVSLLARVRIHLAAGLLGLMFLLWVVLLHSPRVAKAPHNANEWTSEFVALAMCGASLVLSEAFAKRWGRE